MSAELVASAHKTVHISLPRDRARLGSDVAILIERTFAEFAPAAWRYSPQSFALSDLRFAHSILWWAVCAAGTCALRLSPSFAWQ